MMINTLQGALVIEMYNNSGSTISKGKAVAYNPTVSNVPWSGPGPDVTKPCIGITLCTAVEENFLGVAQADIPNGTAGPVVIFGRALVNLAASVSGAAGDTLAADANGRFAEVTDGTGSIGNALLLVATVTSAGETGTLAWAWVDFRIGGGMGGAS